MHTYDESATVTAAQVAADRERDLAIREANVDLRLLRDLFPTWPALPRPTIQTVAARLHRSVGVQARHLGIDTTGWEQSA
jgi:hypothetical protein